MKYAIISDAHANPLALAAALTDAHRRRCDRFVLLGDMTGYGYDVVDVVRIVRENFDVVLMGNHDSACVGLEPWMEVHTNKNYHVDVLQRGELSSDDVEWIKALPYLHVEGNAAFVHGDFTCPEAWRYVFYPQDAIMNMMERDEQLLFCGHTHHAEAWELSPDMSLSVRHSYPRPKRMERSVSKTFMVKTGCRYVINVGSVGYPRFDTCSTYVIYDEGAHRITFRHMPFDLGAYAEKLSGKGISIPFWLDDLLHL